MSKKKGKPKPPSVWQRIRAFVYEKGEATTEEVIAAVGRHISAARAAARGRVFLRTACRRPHWREDRLTPERLIFHGRKDTIRNSLVCMTRRGQLRRVRRAVYGPPLPKLHEEPPVPQAG